MADELPRITNVYNGKSVGELSAVVISPPPLVEEAMKKNGVAFVNRPEVLMSKAIFYNSVDPGSSKYDEYWRQMRKLFILELLSSKKVHSFNALMEEEVSRLLSYIRYSEGLPINVSENVASDQESITRLAKETASFDGELFTAGTDTSATVIKWAMAELMKNPRVMKKAQSEVRQAFKGKENFTDFDIRKLNYLNMKLREKCTIDGYDILVNTITLVNAWSIGRDPKYWHNPESFEPERFSNSSVHYIGNHYEYLPFGAGRRVCPGITFGVATVELVLAKLLYYFDWKLPDGISLEEFDMIEKFGATAGKKNGLYLIPKSYIPSDG
ncbi:Cytochrome [Forsythia ovata]|uniref:Cytochrome n=1 Tax=Forsythia ovata TaxID=205694 RepID=A0ABD1RND5_9LAMI